MKYGYSFFTAILFAGMFASPVLSIKISRQQYAANQDLVKWTLTNKGSAVRYYLVGIQIKTDTGWPGIKPSGHNLVAKDVLILSQISPGKTRYEQVEIRKILWEKSHRGFDKKYNQYRLALTEFEKRDFQAKYFKAKYAEFKITD